MNTLNLSLRQRKLLHILQNQTAYITGAKLAKQLRVSSRTIRNDVVVINHCLSSYHARINSEHSKGYLFEARNPDQIQELNQIDTAFFTKEDRVRYLAFQLCLADAPISMYDLEDEMYISHTTLEHDLHLLRLYYVLSAPHIHLIRNADTLEFEKDEKAKRFILNHLFHEYWNYDTKGNTYYNYDFLDSTLLDEIMDVIPLYLKKHNVQMEDSNLVSLNLSIAIMHQRILQGCTLPDHPPVPKHDSAAMNAVQNLLDDLEGRLHCAFSQTERDEIYLEVASGHLMDASQLNFQTVTAYFGPVTIEMANHYLDDLNQTFQLDFRDDEDFYITLLQYIRYLQSPVPVFNTQENADIAKSYLLVEFELACLFQRTALEYLGHYLNQPELLYLARCISGTMEYLYHNHPECKIKTVIACHLNLPAVWALKRKILGAFENYIEITALIPVNARSAFDFSETDLVLTTVRKKITEQSSTDTLQISALLEPSDYRNMEEYIQKKRIQKLCPKSSLSLSTLLEEAYWHENSAITDPFAAIECMANDFIDNKLTSSDYLNDLLRKESISSNAFQSGILFLYSLTPAEKTALSVMTSEHHILWNTHKIHMVIMAAFHPKDLRYLFYLFYVFYFLPYDISDLKAQKVKEKLLFYFSSHSFIL